MEVRSSSVAWCMSSFVILFIRSFLGGDMTATVSIKGTLPEQIAAINKKYQAMQRLVLQLMTHPEADAEAVEIGRQCLIRTAAALLELQVKLEQKGFSVERLEGITKKQRRLF